MSIEMEGIPDQMTLAELGARCQREIANFRKGLPYDDRYCLEIFHRAILKENDQAWEWLVNNYSRMVLSWFHSHPRREEALRHEPDEEYYVGYTFTRFWQATHNQSLKFDSLAAALRYLKLTLSAAVSDTLRSYARPVVPLPEPGMGLPDEPVAEDEPEDGRALWEAIESLLPTKRQKLVAYLIIHCGLKPKEIMQLRPGLFNNVKEIYKTYRNVLERLERNMDWLRWRLGDVERFEQEDDGDDEDEEQ
jgi:integrase